MRSTYLVSVGVVLVAAAVSVTLSHNWFGGPSGPAIYVDGGRLVIENHTDQTWQDVRVTVNAYYQGVSPTLEPGARLEAPLASLVSGLGYRFNTAREHVTTVEVHATDARGKPIALRWDEKTGTVVDEGKE